MKTNKKYDKKHIFDDEESSDEEQHNKGFGPEVLEQIKHIMKVTEKYKDGIPLEKYNEWKYEISNPNYDKESEKQRRMNRIKLEMGNCGHDCCDTRKHLLSQSYDEIINLHIEVDPEWEYSTSILPVPNVNEQIREIAHYVYSYGVKYNQAIYNVSKIKKYDKQTIGKFKASKKEFDDVSLETIGIDMKGMEDYFKCLHFEIENDIAKHFNSIKNYKSNNDLLSSIMNIYFTFKLLAKVYDSVFEAHNIIGIIKAFKLSISCDHNLIKTIINGIFWDNVFKFNSLMDLLATPDSDFVNLEANFGKRLENFIKIYKDFKNLYYTYYSRCNGFKIDISYGFKYVEKNRKKNERMRNQFNPNSVNLDDLCNFINSSKVVNNPIDDDNNLEIHFPNALSEEDKNNCIICFDNERSALFVPCGHLITCLDCADAVSNTFSSCPLCKKKIECYKNFQIRKKWQSCYLCKKSFKSLSYFIPCGHSILCEGCGNNLMKNSSIKCPECSNEITKMISQIFC